MVKLTRQSLANLKPRAKPYIEYDSELIGFGVAVYPSGIKSWVCEYRPHGGGRGVAKKRVTLGKTSQLTPDQARKAAADMLAAVQLGGDPAQEKAERRASVTAISKNALQTNEKCEPGVVTNFGPPNRSQINAA